MSDIVASFLLALPPPTTFPINSFLTSCFNSSKSCLIYFCRKLLVALIDGSVALTLCEGSIVFGEKLPIMPE